MRIHFRLTVLAAALAASTLGVAAQQTDPSSPASPRPRPTPDSPRSGTAAPNPSQRRGDTTAAASRSTLSSSDMKFAKEAADGGMAEVELGRLATTRAANDQVKQFGQRMVDDHGKANKELMDLARRHNITLPTTLTGKHKSEYDRLSKLSGEQFDREYVKLMVADHKKDVDDFRKQSTAAKDPDLRMFANETLPTLEDHLTTIQRLSREGVAATSGSSRDSGSNRPRGTGGSSGR